MSVLRDMAERHVSCVPVVDERQQLVDIYTKLDIIVSIVSQRSTTVISSTRGVQNVLQLDHKKPWP